MKKLDKIIYINSILLIIIPTIIFFVGFIKPIISIPLSILTIVLTWFTIKKYKYTNYKINKKYWIIALIVLFIWLLFSGIGDFTYQNVVDFHFRHAMLRDLINYKWPIMYKNNGLVYYVTFFLPIALVGKITTYKIANIFMFLYSYFFIVNTLYFINRYIKKDSYFSLIFLILFSGLDIIGIPNYLFTTKPLEWWNGLFQYSSNTTSLYWTFNQALPIWLITSLILNTKDSKSIILISSVSFFYSPYTTICFIPVTIYLVFKNSNNIKKDLLSLYTLYTIIITIVLGLYYTSIPLNYYSGFIFNIVKNKYIILPSYILFILLELGLFIIPTYKINKKDLLYRISIIELLIIPIYVISENNDFCMRGAVPLLFIIMIYFIKYMDNKKYKKSIMIYIFILISFITPIHEISRSIYYTFTTKDYIADKVISIGNPKAYKELATKQFYGDLNSIFFKYIAK